MNKASGPLLISDYWIIIEFSYSLFQIILKQIVTKFMVITTNKKLSNCLLAVHADMWLFLCPTTSFLIQNGNNWSFLDVSTDC